jgi:SAM-dependent methyltransferase
MKCIQVNPDGSLQIGDEVLSDIESGQKLLKSFHMKGHLCYAQIEEEPILVESKKFPLIVQRVRVESQCFCLSFNYGFEYKFNLKEGLFLTDWSELSGFTDKKVPFVFSAEAQEVFLNQLVNSESYDFFEFQEKEYELEDWYIENKSVESADSWSGRYIEADTPWDLGKAHPCLEWTLPRLKLSKSKILVPGCGSGHDAAKLKSLGHPTTGLDFSEEALNKAQKLYPHVPFLHSDIFSHEKKHQGDYDVIFEHTLFCAMNPSLRTKLIKTWHSLLSEKGHLMAVFMVGNKRKGPPFGVSEWELEQLLEKHFKIEYWGRLRGEESARQGKELFVFAQKK